MLVDTGSTDRTCDIAAEYTDRIYDFTWIDDFAAARNFAFSKASGDYIYSCDADEILDRENYEKFAALKEAILPEIEIVQMLYEEDATTVLNARREYRAKLFKRLRTFTWQDPVHETIRLEPVVYDSDIVIFHRPRGEHQRRDFDIFIKAFERGERFTKNLYHTYASELYKCGTPEDFLRAVPVFADRMEMRLDADGYAESACVLAHAYRCKNEPQAFLEYALQVVAGGACSEICYELGAYYQAAGLYAEAAQWLMRALYEAAPLVDIHTAGDTSFGLLAECYDRLGDEALALEYRRLEKEWKLPQEKV